MLSTEKKPVLKALRFTLLHKEKKPEVVYYEVPKEPSFRDIFYDPCKKWLDKGYYIKNVKYYYETPCL